MRFNGPARANNPKDLLSDLKIIRVMVKSQQGSNGISTSGGSAAASSASATAARAATSLEVLQQLPNTVSVSIKGVKSYTIIEMLSEKVRHALVFTGVRMFGRHFYSTPVCWFSCRVQ